MNKGIRTILFLILCFTLTGCQPTTITLLKAIENDNLEGVQKIVNQIDVNEKNSDGVIPIFFAIERGNSEIAAALIEAGARCDIMDEEKNTPLHIAVLEQKDDMINLLLDSSNLDTQNVHGKTPIDIAEEKENYSFLTKVYFEKDDIDNTIKYGEMSIQKNDSDIGSKYYLSSSLFSQTKALKSAGKLEEAISVAERADTYCDEILDLKPDSEDTKMLETEVLEVLNMAKSELEEKQAVEKAATEKAAAQKVAAQKAVTSKPSSSPKSSGTSNSSVKYCTSCKGSGKIKCSQCDEYGRTFYIDRRICSICGGAAYKTCSTCRGSGVIIR